MQQLRDKAVKSICRFCDAPLKHTFVDLGMSPLCESYVSAEAVNRVEPFYPLHAYVCEQCFLVQLDQYVSAEDIFMEYAYFSSYSDSWLRHAKNYTDMIISRLDLDQRSLVMELASNDRYLLQYFVQAGIPAIGNEPAANIAEVAVKKGVPTLVKFFSRQVARELTGERGAADLIIGNNVLAQVPDLNDFVAAMKIALKPNGVIAMEFPHLMRLIEENQFDTIYHEHFSYFSFVAAERIFSQHGLVLFDVEELSTHGGSLRIYARHAEDSSKPVGARSLALRRREEETGFLQLGPYLSFGEKVKGTKRALLDFLIRAKREGKTIVGYRAPGKATRCSTTAVFVRTSSITPSIAIHTSRGSFCRADAFPSSLPKRSARQSPTMSSSYRGTSRIRSSRRCLASGNGAVGSWCPFPRPKSTHNVRRSDNGIDGAARWFLRGLTANGASK